MPSSQPENHLDNDKEELRLKLLAEISDYSDSNNNEAGHHNAVYASKELLKIVDQYTQSKLKAFAGEVKQLIEKSKEDNLDYHGRPDCKNCSLIEDLEALKAIKERWNLNG